MTINSHLILGLLGLMLALGSVASTRSLYDNQNEGFDENYVVGWGEDHVKFLDNGRLVQLSMDKSSGSGFSSKMAYNSGFFHFAIKTPSKDTAGVVAAFYLSSSTKSHDELDFEFLGNRKGKPVTLQTNVFKPVTLQTNVFTNSHGNREQRVHLWFDPADAFHDYAILWNPYHIVFFVDGIPLRVFSNQTSRGVEFPSQPMKIMVSLWNGEDWATNGGKDKINWAGSPFISQFQGFRIDGCSSDNQSCYSEHLWWNVGRYKELTDAQKAAYEKVKKHYTSYDYCSDRQRFPTMPLEC